MQFNVKYLSCYETHYGSNTDLGRSLADAQAQTFKFENLGVPVTVCQLEIAKNQVSRKNFPKRFPGTSRDDYKEAVWVSQQDSVTYGDLDRYRKGDESVSNLHGSGYEALPGDMIGKKSEEADRLQTMIEQSKLQSNQVTESRLSASRKNMTTNIDFILNHPHVNESHLNELERAVTEATDKIIAQIKEEHGVHIDSEKNITWGAESMRKGEVKKRKRGHAG